MKTMTLIVVFALACMSAPGMAQDFNLGMAAAQRGDYVTALRQWRPLAERGNAAAQFNLGLMYAERLGVVQSDAEAVRWWRLSAKQGFPSAQTSLAWMYANGWGVAQDYTSAYMWSSIAASNGYEDAARMRDLVAGYMSRTSISEAQRRARACVVSGYQGCE